MHQQSVAGCDLNPLSKSWLASPCPRLRIKIMMLKIALVLFGTALDAFPTIQAPGMLICSAWIVWSDIKAVRHEPG